MNASRNITWQYYDVIMRHDGVILRDMSQYYVVSFVDVIHLILLLVACHTPDARISAINMHDVIDHNIARSCF